MSQQAQKHMAESLLFREIHMRALFLLTVLLLSGCASKIVEYQPAAITDAQARSLIEQVLMEQPVKSRPEQVVITGDYIAYGSGIVSETNSFGSATAIGDSAFALGSSRTHAKALQTRIYFNSIGTVTLYSRRGRWIVVTRNQAGAVLNSSLIDTQAKAQRFVDSVMHFRKA